MNCGVRRKLDFPSLDSEAPPGAGSLAHLKIRQLSKVTEGFVCQIPAQWTAS